MLISLSAGKRCNLNFKRTSRGGDAVNLRTGIDLTAVNRIESVLRRFEGKFKKRFFPEIQDNSDLPAETYAGLWAAKEAVFKAIGRGYRWSGVTIEYESSGRPIVRVDYQEARLTETTIPREADWDCSITHDGGLALAFAACTWS
jgi:phosphopantetheine--protein transferase-like protein